MSTENDILDPKLHASDNINDPTYPGPDGKMLIFKRNLALYLAQTKLPKAVYDHVSFASQVLTLPPSYKMLREVKITATPQDKEDSKAANKVWTEDPDGTPKKGLIFSKSGSLLEGLEMGSIQEIPEPCKVPKKARELLEMHCYVHTHHQVRQPCQVSVHPHQQQDQIWRFSCPDACTFRQGST
jgi:hypothetical protein